MLFAVISDVVWQALIAGVVTCVLAWMSNRNRTSALKTADEVKQTLVETNLVKNEKLDAIAATADKTHELVNSGALAQYKLGAELSRWKADQTKLPADVAAAEKAEDLYRVHASKQASVDSHS